MTKEGMMATTAALQVIDHFLSWDRAYACHMAQRAQVGYFGGRVYYDRVLGGWVSQSFHAPDGLVWGQWLPAGMRLVQVPDTLVTACFDGRMR